MADRPRATAMTCALIVSLLANVTCGLFWPGSMALTTTREENQARAAEITKLKAAVDASRKLAEEDKAAMNLARECQSANADLERRNRSLADDVTALKKSVTARLKELDEHKASAASPNEKVGRGTPDEEARSLNDEISELQKAVGASQAEREESREKREEQLNDIRDRNARLLEKIRNLTAEQKRRPNSADCSSRRS